MKRFPAMQDWPLLEILALTATVEAGVEVARWAAR